MNFLLLPVLAFSIIAAFAFNCWASGDQPEMQVQPDAHESLNNKSTATLQVAEGDVRIKERNQYLWKKALPGAELFPGDKVFTGKDGAAKIVYTKQKQVISMKPQALTRIGFEAPRISQFKRIFGAESQGASGKAENQKGAQAGVRVLGRPDFVPFENSSQAEGGHSGAKLGTGESEVRPLQIIYPNPRTIVGLTKSNARISVQVAQDFKNEKLWVYVWQRGKGLAPVQRKFTLGDLPDLSFAEPGKYIVQVVCEDESCASRPLYVEVLQGSREEIIKKISSFKLDADTTVVLP